MPRIKPSTAHINPFGLRMQPELRQKLEKAAAEGGRSLNTEITSRLEETLNPLHSATLKSIFEAAQKATIEELLEMQRIMIGRHSGESLFLHGVIRGRLGVLDKAPEGDDPFQID